MEEAIEGLKPDPTVPVNALKEAVQQYRMQHEQASQALQKIEEQRELVVKTLDTLTGAITALELLIPQE